MNKKEFDLWLAQLGFIPEVMFKGIKRDRRWRYDYTHHGHRIAIDYQGLGRGGNESHLRGGHETRKGINNDTAKHTEASIEGWTVILCTRDTIKDGQCQFWIEEAMRRTS